MHLIHLVSSYSYYTNFMRAVENRERKVKSESILSSNRNWGLVPSNADLIRGDTVEVWTLALSHFDMLGYEMYTPYKLSRNPKGSTILWTSRVPRPLVNTHQRDSARIIFWYCYPYCGRRVKQNWSETTRRRRKTTCCRDMGNKFESLPGHDSERLLTHQCKAASSVKLLPRYE